MLEDKLRGKPVDERILDEAIAHERARPGYFTRFWDAIRKPVAYGAAALALAGAVKAQDLPHTTERYRFETRDPAAYRGELDGFLRRQFPGVERHPMYDTYLRLLVENVQTRGQVRILDEFSGIATAIETHQALSTYIASKAFVSPPVADMLRSQYESALLKKQPAKLDVAAEKARIDYFASTPGSVARVAKGQHLHDVLAQRIAGFDKMDDAQRRVIYDDLVRVNPGVVVRAGSSDDSNHWFNSMVKSSLHEMSSVANSGGGRVYYHAYPDRDVFIPTYSAPTHTAALNK